MVAARHEIVAYRHPIVHERFQFPRRTDVSRDSVYVSRVRKVIVSATQNGKKLVIIRNIESIVDGVHENRVGIYVGRNGITALRSLYGVSAQVIKQRAKIVHVFGSIVTPALDKRPLDVVALYVKVVDVRFNALELFREASEKSARSYRVSGEQRSVGTRIVYVAAVAATVSATASVTAAVRIGVIIRRSRTAGIRTAGSKTARTSPVTVVSPITVTIVAVIIVIIISVVVIVIAGDSVRSARVSHVSSVRINSARQKLLW